MASPLTITEFRQLREFIEKHCGIVVGDEKGYLIESRLSGLLTQSGASSFGEFYQKVVGDPALGLRDKIVDAMTTNETLWFRDSHPFNILREALLPRFAEDLAAGCRSRVRIWCAACSTGQEPYSVAMTLREYAERNPAFNPASVDILATDISPSVLFLAAAGRYDRLSMSRGLTEGLKGKYFEKSGMIWALKEEIRKAVTFKKLNLQESFAALGRFDLVLCRNVAIYFGEVFKRDLFGRLSALLRPEGFLMLGSAESVSGYSGAYRMLTLDKGIYYQVKQEDA